MTYNEDMAVKSLDEMYKYINKREISIGELEMTCGVYDLIVIGNQIYTNDMSRKLKKIGKDDFVVKDRYIESQFGRHANKIIYDSSIENKEEIRKFVNDINEAKLVAVMFRSGAEIILSEDNRAVNLRIKYNEVVLNTNNHIVFRVVMNVDKNKTRSIEVAEYNKMFRLNSSVVGSAIKERDWARDLIDITNCGLVRTIKIQYGDKYIVIDNSYCVVNDDVVGVWNNGRIKFIDEFVDKDITELVGSIDAFIGMHRRYIIPYKMCKENIVEVK